MIKEENTISLLDPAPLWSTLGNCIQRICEASKVTSGKVTRTHRLSAYYPKVAKYKGIGSIDEAENLVCNEQKPGGIRYSA